jgi:hypothetical protein
MITANYINEGATLIITADGQRHGIPVTDDSQVFCEALFREVNSANAMVDFFAWIVANCKIIHWPGGGHYPIEHAPAANKDGIPHLKAAMNKEGMYAQPLTKSRNGEDGAPEICGLCDNPKPCKCLMELESDAANRKLKGDA